MLLYYGINKITMDKFVEMIIPFAVKANNEIKNGEVFDVKLVDDPILKNLLENSNMFKDSNGEIWFFTTNIKIIQFITEVYFGKNFELLHSFPKKTMNKEEMCKRMDLPRTTAHRQINELIDFGLIVIQNKKCSNSSNRRRTDTFCRLFDKFEYVEATNVKVNSMKFRINKNILKINRSNKHD